MEVPADMLPGLPLMCPREWDMAYAEAQRQIQGAKGANVERTSVRSPAVESERTEGRSTKEEIPASGGRQPPESESQRPERELLDSERPRIGGLTPPARQDNQIAA